MEWVGKLVKQNAVLYSYLYFSFTRICYRIRAVFPSELNLFPYSQNDESMLRVRQLDLLPKWCKQCSFKVFSTWIPSNPAVRMPAVSSIDVRVILNITWCEMNLRAMMWYELEKIIPQAVPRIKHNNQITHTWETSWYQVASIRKIVSARGKSARTGPELKKNPGETARSMEMNVRPRNSPTMVLRT